MSQNFVEFIFPCKDCVVLAACNFKLDDERLVHLHDEFSPRCLAVPKLLDDVSYIKTLIECWANIGHRIICNMQKTEDPRTQTETNNNIPMQYVMLMGQMAGLMQWIVNSTSWELGELKEFDMLEIRHKCKTIKM